MKIYKYTMDKPTSTFDIPIGARVLSVGIQQHPVIWAIVDPSMPTEKRKFTAINTGVDCPDYRLGFIGTVTSTSGIVWHIFEITELEKSNE